MNSKPSRPTLLSRLARWMRSRVGIGIALLLVALGLLAAAGRAYLRYAVPASEIDYANSGMADFHNGVFFPSIAFARGINPYASEVVEHCPMARSTPPYSPLIFMIYQPFTWLNLPAADIAFFSFNAALLALLAWLIVRTNREQNETRFELSDADNLLARIPSNWILALWMLTLLLWSRPGHITLFTGYFTLQLVIGSLLAVSYSRRLPWLAGVGVLLASGKPTYVIPLSILLLARRDYRAFFWGSGLTAVVGVAGLAWLASFSDLATVLEGIREGQDALDADPAEFPVNSWTRLDAMGLVAKMTATQPGGAISLAVMLLMLVPVAATLWLRLSQESFRQHETLSSSLILLTMLVSIYHHSYDSLLAAIVWGWLALSGRTLIKGLKQWELLALLVLLSVPAVNYISTLRFREWAGFESQSLAWQLVTSANGVCLLACLIGLLGVAWRGQARGSS